MRSMYKMNKNNDMAACGPEREGREGRELRVVVVGWVVPPSRPPLTRAVAAVPRPRAGPGQPYL